MRNNIPESQKIINRLQSMFFMCVYCDSPTPLALIEIEHKNEKGRTYFTAFAICPHCRNKFSVKIEDHGKVSMEKG